jgi:ABC-type uncharacterized transport system permease subunit
MPQVSQVSTVPRSRSAVSIRPFALLAVLTSIAIFCQALTAGQFVSQDGGDSWVTMHGVIADISWVMALITAGYAWKTLRASHPRMVVWCATLFVIVLAQTGIGHLITDDGHDWLIGVHVPLAFIIFGLTTWVSTQAVRLSRRELR